MKLITNTQVTVDGIMQANGGNDPDLDPGFTRGGWAMPFDEPESTASIAETYLRADAFLFGRRTYDLFAAYWGGVRKDDTDDPFVRSLSGRPKYVASDSLTEPSWAGTTVLPGRGADDGAALEASVRALKAEPGGELQVHGSGQLIRWLLARGLVDELTLIVFPVVVGGGGIRLFPDDGPDVALELLDARTFSNGIVAQTYRPGGRPEYA